ncbi:MAG: NAD-dependent epimerase/dehydratase family protein [bacterium]|nr:NAD-dependent epimerase/dehydratase family protein [bacterium]
MKKVLVTGINGLLGTNLTVDLLTKGYLVKGLIRDKSKFKGHQHQNLELIQGNLFDDITPYLHQVDILIHVAAETSQNLPAYSDYWRINYNATIQLFNSAITCHLKKFIFISTANTMGYGSLEDLGTEEKKIRYPFSDSFYAKSKLEAENYLLANKYKIDVNIIHPGFMLGAFDTKPSSGQIILMAWKKKIIFYPPGGKNFVHVKDVSKGIIKSLENGKNGERFLLVNQNLSYFNFFKKLNSVSKQNPLMIKIPRSILISLGYLGDLARYFGIKSSLSSNNMRILCINNFYSNSKSVKDLEMDYVSIDSAIDDAISYFKNTFHV